MAFPGYFNISYYRGDSYEFRVYPKDAAGAAFSLDGYSVKFRIAETRGATALIEGYASIDETTKSFITCAIQPGNGASMDPTKKYVYDVEVTKTASPYPFPLVYTLLTGEITLVEQVTPPAGG